MCACVGSVVGVVGVVGVVDVVIDGVTCRC